jgi:hypothetical protein
LGDWTPYWEDGAGSSALETAMNRASSDRLAQAEALFAMLKPAGYPRAAFEDAWNSVLLYSEHTWGAWCSVSEPQRKETLEQWEIMRGYAESADKQSGDLLTASLARSDADAQKPNAMTYSTPLLPRTEWRPYRNRSPRRGPRQDDKGKLSRRNGSSPANTSFCERCPAFHGAALHHRRRRRTHEWQSGCARPDARQRRRSPAGG